MGEKMPTGRERSERLLIMLNPEELTAIDDFRFARRMPNRAAAVRELLRRALSAEGFPVAATAPPKEGVTQRKRSPPQK
jgi:hypothetical protein